MELWRRVKSGLEEGLSTISEKTGEMSKLAKMKWEKRNIEKKIHHEFQEIGHVVFELSKTGNESQLQPGISTQIEILSRLEKELADKEAEIEEFTAKIDSKQVKGLKKDLEMGDGTIEQIVLDDASELAGKKLMEISLPANVLVGTIVRQDQVIIPDGSTVLNPGDKVTLLGKKEDVEATIAQLCGENS